MQSTLAERVRECIDRLGMTEAQVAHIVGVAAPSVYAWLNGKTKRLYGMNLIRAAELFGVRPQWLDTGEGPKSADDHGARFMLADSTDAHTSKHEHYTPVPRYDVALKAGSGPNSNEHEEISGRHMYRTDWLVARGYLPAALCVVDVDGDSMRPTLENGDHALVNTADKRIVSGKVYAIRVGDEVRVKRLFKQMDGRIRVVSDNPEYPVDYLTPDTPAEVIGRVVHRGGEL